MLNTIFTFPGQGIITKNIFLEQLKNDENLERNCQKASSILNIHITEAIEKEIIHGTVFSQLCTFIFTYSQYQKVKQELSMYNPYYFCGHSLGEITALTCANVITFEDAIKYVYERAKIMEECCKEKDGGMLAILGENLEEVLKEDIDRYNLFISNYNSSSEVIVSGLNTDLAAFENFLIEKKVTYKKLYVSGAFHSDFMKGAYEKMKRVEYSYNSKKLDRVYSSFLGRRYKETDNIFELLALQIISPVKWNELMGKLKDDNILTVIEVTPKILLSNFFERSYKQIFSTHSSCSEKFYLQIKERLNENRLALLKKIISIAVCSKNFTSKERYEKYKLEYKQILKKCNSLIDTKDDISKEMCVEFYERLFYSLLILKELPEAEIDFRKEELENLFHIGDCRWVY